MSSEFKNLLDDLASARLAQHREQIDAAIEDARELIEHGDVGTALEDICQNLYEWDFPLSRAHYDRLQQIGRSLGFKSRTWSFLEEIVA